MENAANAENKELYRLFLERLGTTTTLTGKMKPLKALLPLDYAQTERLILHVGLQMQVLLEEQQGICGFTLDDITVLEGEYYLLTGLQQVVSVSVKNSSVKNSSVKNSYNKKEPLFTYTYPMKFSEAAKELLAPELREKLAAKVLPFTTSLSVGYYSLAKLCLMCLGLMDNLEALRGSKMYYCLERCLREVPAERAFLYF
jgi:hypothetical protein